MSLKGYSSSANPTFPQKGDKDAIRADAKTAENGSKVRVKFVNRWLSVFPSQLRPIADFFEENPDVEIALVDWVEEMSPAGRPNTVAKVHAAKKLG